MSLPRIMTCEIVHTNDTKHLGLGACLECSLQAGPINTRQSDGDATVQKKKTRVGLSVRGLDDIEPEFMRRAHPTS